MHMGFVGGLAGKALFLNKVEPSVREMARFSKVKKLHVIIQTSEGIDDRVKRYIKRYGGNIGQEFPFINACNAALPAAAIKPLESLFQIRYISLDHVVEAHTNTIASVPGISMVHGIGHRGKKIRIALLDTGTYPHPDIIRPRNRILCFKDFVNQMHLPYDDNGHGTFSAGIILGNGAMSDNTHTGIAPEAELISLKVLNQSGKGRVSTVLSAMQWLFDNKATYNIAVVCIPLGYISFAGWEREPLSRAVQALWNHGMVVCTSAGNYGPYSGWIASPGINPHVITVGAICQDKGNHHRKQSLCTFSSRGPVRNGGYGPDFVAPGSNVLSLATDITFYPDSSAFLKTAKLDSYYARGSGTSASCAFVAGLAALLLENNRELSPDEVKSLLRHSCFSLNLVKSEQGYGMPDVSRIFN
jgi:serine protease AprX